MLAEPRALFAQYQHCRAGVAHLIIRHCAVGWDAYDPYYRPAEPAGSYDTIVCTLVLNALSRNNRAKVLAHIQALLVEDGRAYLGVARDLPYTGKLGMHHSLQNYVVLTLPWVYADAQ